jgi:hypothetical protein
MRALLLCNYEIFGAAMVTEHINAIVEHSSFDIYVHKDLVKNRGNLKLEVDLNEFDIIIVHYSIFLAIDAYCSTKTKAALKAAHGVKAAFLQDEYRFVDRSIGAMRDAGIDLVFSCVPEASISKVYPPEKMKNIRVVNVLTGYTSSYLTTIAPIELKKRRFDVSYRGRRYPDWHGSMGREKYEIAEQFQKRARFSGLRTNISCKENDRLYGVGWVELIRNSRAVLGVESGASIFDFSGEISSRTETKRALLGNDGITYGELRRQYFEDLEGTIDLAQISPRVMEAICLRTMCVLFEGSYSGLLKPNVHYLPLKKDFSNFSEVKEKILDKNYVSEIVTNAYTDVAINESLSYKTFITQFDKEILKTVSDRQHEILKEPVAAAEAPSGAPDTGFLARHKGFLRKRHFRRHFDKEHPFSPYPYPHGVVSVAIRNRWYFKIANYFKDRLPHGARAVIRSLIR